MIRTLRSLLVLFLFLPIAGVAAQPPGSAWLPGRDTATAVVLAHGRGGGPDSTVVGPLRKAINSELGLHTLSLQMPVLPDQDFKAYASTFPDAYRTIQLAIDDLIKERSVKRIYLIGYSMGARMTTAFLADHPQPAVVGYVGVGLLEGGGAPLDANQSIRRIPIAVLDVYADQTPQDRSSAENRQSLVSNRYRQVRIEGASHNFHGHESQLVQAVVGWLKEQERTR